MYQSKMQMQQENVDKGQLQITVVNSENGRPVENAVVRISYSGDPESTVEELRTDESGKTPVLDMKTPLWNTAWNLWRNSPMRNILYR